MIDPAKPFASRRPPRQIVDDRADLVGLLQRARDERYRLLKMLRDARAAVNDAAANGSAPPRPAAVQVAVPPVTAAAPVIAAPPVPAAEAADNAAASPPAAVSSATSPPAALPDEMRGLAEKLAQLNARIDAKQRRHHQLDQRTRAELETLAESALAAAATLEGSRQKADASTRHLSKLTAQAGQLHQTVAGQLVRCDQYLDGQTAAARDLIDQHLVAGRDALLADCRSQLTADLQRHEARLYEAQRSVEQQLTTRFDELADGLQTRAQQMLAHVTAAADRAGQQLRKQTVRAMAQTQDIQASFADRLADDCDTHRQQLHHLVEESDVRLLEQARHLDEHFALMSQRFEEESESLLAGLRSRAEAELRRLAPSAGPSPAPPAPSVAPSAAPAAGADRHPDQRAA